MLQNGLCLAFAKDHSTGFPLPPAYPFRSGHKYTNKRGYRLRLAPSVYLSGHVPAYGTERCMECQAGSLLLSCAHAYQCWSLCILIQQQVRCLLRHLQLSALTAQQDNMWSVSVLYFLFPANRFLYPFDLNRFRRGEYIHHNKYLPPKNIYFFLFLRLSG